MEQRFGLVDSENGRRLMELEVQGLTGADYGESAPDRLAQRNGYRDRIWETRAGTAACPHATNRQLRRWAWPASPRARS